jgi:hypothetical protein
MPDMVNHPPHYRRGPLVEIDGDHYEIEAIDVIRWIRDARLANAMKYIWRVNFGGKADNVQDIQKAIWYLTDWLNHDIDA